MCRANGRDNKRKIFGKLIFANLIFKLDIYLNERSPQLRLSHKFFFLDLQTHYVQFNNCIFVHIKYLMFSLLFH